MSLSTGQKVGIGVAVAGALAGIGAAIASTMGGGKPSKIGRPRLAGAKSRVKGKLVGGDCGCGR